MEFEIEIKKIMSCVVERILTSKPIHGETETSESSHRNYIGKSDISSHQAISRLRMYHRVLGYMSQRHDATNNEGQ